MISIFIFLYVAASYSYSYFYTNYVALMNIINDIYFQSNLTTIKCYTNNRYYFLCACIALNVIHIHHYIYEHKKFLLNEK